MFSTVKPVYNGHSQKHKKLVFKSNYCLMQVKSIAECSKGSILPFIRHSLSYHSSFRSLFCLFLSGCFKQVLLYLYQSKCKLAFNWFVFDNKKVLSSQAPENACDTGRGVFLFALL